MSDAKESMLQQATIHRHSKRDSYDFAYMQLGDIWNIPCDGELDLIKKQRNILSTAACWRKRKKTNFRIQTFREGDALIVKRVK